MRSAEHGVQNENQSTRLRLPRSLFSNHWVALHLLRTGAATCHCRRTRYSFGRSHVPVAQLDRASASGAEGYRFNSCRAYWKIKQFFKPAISSCESQCRSVLTPSPFSAELLSRWARALQPTQLGLTSRHSTRFVTARTIIPLPWQGELTQRTLSATIPIRIRGTDSLAIRGLTLRVPWRCVWCWTHQKIRTRLLLTPKAFSNLCENSAIDSPASDEVTRLVEGMLPRVPSRLKGKRPALHSTGPHRVPPNYPVRIRT